MRVYQLGVTGDEVRAIQRKLSELGLYRGPIDGDFGGGTHAAVAAFQRQKHLPADGRVGANTWQALLQQDIPPPALHGRELVFKCLALTGSFETGVGVPECFCGLGGDFDGQGISFGVLQWNFGQGTLQVLLKDMIERHPQVIQGIFGAHYDAFAAALESGKDELLEFARSVQHPVSHAIFEPWRGFAKALGRTPEFQQVQIAHARGVFERALALCAEFALWSERAVALMFDILTQNGGFAKVTRARIRAEIATLPAGLGADEREVRAMEIVANRRAEAANPRWVDDVRVRKLCIARGAGTVHGIHYDLEQQLGLALRRYAV